MLSTVIFLGTHNKILQCNITLSSSIGPDHSVLNVTWMHNNQSISASDGVSISFNMAGRVVNMFQSNLTLDHITNSTGGVYCCRGEIVSSTKHDCVSLLVTGMQNIYLSTDIVHCLEVLISGNCALSVVQIYKYQTCTRTSEWAAQH